MAKLARIFRDYQGRKNIIEFVKKYKKLTLKEIRDASIKELITLPSNLMSDQEVGEYLLFLGMQLNKNEESGELEFSYHVDDDSVLYADQDEILLRNERVAPTFENLHPSLLGKRTIMSPFESSDCSTPKRKRDEIVKTSRRISDKKLVEEEAVMRKPFQPITELQAQTRPSKANDHQVDKETIDLTRAAGSRRSQRILNFQNSNNSKQTATSSKSSAVSSNFPSKKKSKKSNSLANIKDFVLIGDDNFINIANFDLNFPVVYEGNRKCGFCISGLRVHEACNLLSGRNNNVKKIIVNVGAVDILEDEPLINIVEEYRRLIDICKRKRILAILTTLPPLPSTHLEHKHEALKALNKFILDQKSHFTIINLNKCFVTQKDNSIDYNFFQAAPKKVKGTKASYILWNKPGRSRVLNMLTRYVGFADIYRKNFVGNSL